MEIAVSLFPVLAGLYPERRIATLDVGAALAYE